MMGWYGGHGHMLWFGWAMMAAWIVLIGIIIAIAVYILTRDRRTARTVEPSALQILDMRFARGDIDIADYQERRAELSRGGSS